MALGRRMAGSPVMAALGLVILGPDGGGHGVGTRRDNYQVMPNEGRDTENLGTRIMSGADLPVALGRGEAGPPVMAALDQLIYAPNGGGCGVVSRRDDSRVMLNDGRDAANLGTRGTSGASPPLPSVMGASGPVFPALNGGGRGVGTWPDNSRIS